MTAVVVGLALFSAGDPGREEALSQDPALRSGTLVYVSDAGGGADGQRLWKIDLGSGVLTPGPRVPHVIELQRARLAGLGWVGLTAGRDGSKTAYVLSGTAPADRARILGSGDLVAWGPRGHSVVIARSGPLGGDCRREVTIDVIDVESGTSEREFEQRHLCGDLLSVGRAGVVTYFARISNDRLGIFYAGIGVAHPVLDDHTLIAVSSAGDLLVTAAERPTSSELDRIRSSVGAAPLVAPVGSTVLYWRGLGGPVLLTGEGDVVVIDLVLAWSPDALRAVVAGRLGEREGILEIRVGPGNERRAPAFLIGATSGTGATYATDGTAYIAANGRLFAYSAGRLMLIALPDGAPPPAGPLVWLP